MRVAFLLISVAIYASVVFKNQYRIPHQLEKKEINGMPGTAAAILQPQRELAQETKLVC